MILRTACVLAVASLAIAEPKSSRLDSEIRRRVDGFRGTVSVHAKNLKTGETYSLRGEAPVRTASTIKLPIMVECFAQAQEGKLDLTESLTLTKEEKVSGSGILQEMSDGGTWPVRDVLDLMIVLSDNTATNLILNRIGGDAVNDRMAKLGLRETAVMRKVRGDGNDLKAPSGFSKEGLKPENVKWGLGRSSPQDMVVLLEKLYKGELVSKSASDQMLKILKHQRDRDGIGRDTKDLEVAEKTGALDHLRSDVAIVYSKGGPIAMAITVDNMPELDWTPENPGLLLISSLSEVLMKNLAARE